MASPSTVHKTRDLPISSLIVNSIVGTGLFIAYPLCQLEDPSPWVERVIQNLLYFMKLPPDTQQRLTPEPYLSFLLLTLATAAFAATAVILNRDKRTRLFCLTTICIGTAIWTMSRVTTPGELAFMVIPSLHVVGAGLAQVGGIRGSREKKGVTCNHTYYTYCSRLRGGRDDMEKQAEGEKGLMRFEEADG